MSALIHNQLEFENDKKDCHDKTISPTICSADVPSTAFTKSYVFHSQIVFEEPFDGTIEELVDKFDIRSARRPEDNEPPITPHISEKSNTNNGTNTVLHDHNSPNDDAVQYNPHDRASTIHPQ